MIFVMSKTRYKAKCRPTTQISIFLAPFKNRSRSSIPGQHSNLRPHIVWQPQLSTSVQKLCQKLQLNPYTMFSTRKHKAISFSHLAKKVFCDPFQEIQNPYNNSAFEPTGPHTKHAHPSPSQHRKSTKLGNAGPVEEDPNFDKAA